MALPLIPVLILVVSSLGWAGLDVVRKLLVGKLPSWGVLFLLTSGAVPLFAAWALLTRAALPVPGYWLPAFTSIFINVMANLAYLEAVRFAPLSLAAPLLSLTPAFTALTSIPLLGEIPTPRGMVGIVLVVVGAFLLHQSSGPARRRAEGRAGKVPSEASKEERRRHALGAALAALTALLWSLTLPIDKLALAKASPGFHGVFLNAGVALLTLGVLVGRRATSEIGEGKRAPGLILAAILISFLALGTQLVALPHIPAGTLETLKRGVGNLGAVLFGRIVFGEGVTGGKLLAVAVMVAGVGMILL